MRFHLGPAAKAHRARPIRVMWAFFFFFLTLDFLSLLVIFGLCESLHISSLDFDFAAMELKIFAAALGELLWEKLLGVGW